ncbi:MAG TPA: hypothetical protein VI976_04050, partial [Candidatus Omnitrophota bacterium]|nr:hypothetical protein [Candidatus Omnitrophota bacterium]
MDERIEYEGQELKNCSRNMVIVFGIIILFGFCLHHFTNLTFHQVIACTIFIAAVLETIVFWSFRMGI